MVFTHYTPGDLPVNTDYIKYEVKEGKRPWQDLARAYVQAREKFHAQDLAEELGIDIDEFLDEMAKHMMCFERPAINEEGWVVRKYDDEVEIRWALEVFARGNLRSFLKWYDEYVKKTGWKGGSRVEA